MPQHSTLMGGSIAKRRMMCPGSHSLEAAAPNPPESPYAADGTMKHLAMERLMDDATLTPDALVGETLNGLTVTQEVVDDALIPALDAFHRLQDRYGEIEYVIEARVGDGEVFGTVDLLGTTSMHTVLLDWKFGAGVQVSAKDSYQHRFYGALAMRSASFANMFAADRPVVLAVVQPAVGEGLDVHETTVADLQAFHADMMAAVERIKAGDRTQQGGAWCKFCRAAATYPERRGKVEQLLAARDPEIEPRELGALLDLADEAEEWIRAVRATAHAEMEKGRPVLGWKLVGKRATRKWRDEAEALARLTDAGADPATLTKTELMSPAQVEKALKRLKIDADIREFVVSQSSGTTLARADDDRPAVTPVGAGLQPLDLPTAS